MLFGVLMFKANSHLETGLAENAFVTQHLIVDMYYAIAVRNEY